MTRVKSVSALLVLAGVTVCGCGDAYTAPESPHAVAADIAASRVGEAPLIASDLIDAIPEAYASVLAEWERGR